MRFAINRQSDCSATSNIFFTTPLRSLGSTESNPEEFDLTSIQDSWKIQIHSLVITFIFSWVPVRFGHGFGLSECMLLSPEVFAGRKSRGMVLAAWIFSLLLCIPQAHIFRARRERERRARSTKSTCVNICKVDDRSRSVHRAQSCEAVKKGKLPFDDFNDCR